MQSKVYGYARVSTREQNEDRQVVALKSYGVPEKNIFLDKVSGKDFNRPAYKRLIKRLRPKDTLVIKSIDRLGRNYEDIIDEWRRLTKDIKAYIVVIDLPILDTRVKDEYDVTGTVIADVVLALFGYFAQMERDYIRSRQAEGIALAKEKGVTFGRPAKEKPANLDEYIEKYISKELSSRGASKALNMPQSTFLRRVDEYCHNLHH